jgi:hypothetical protein
MAIAGTPIKAVAASAPGAALAGADADAAVLI